VFLTSKGPPTVPKKNYDCPPEKFVLAWEESQSVEEVAKKLNMPKDIVKARASGYRAQGVHLKKMPRIKTGVDIDFLNKLIDQVHARQATEAKKNNKR
jgi:hypothetical protein